MKILNLKTVFPSATSAFSYYYEIFNSDHGALQNVQDTKALFNVGFYLVKPQQNHIIDERRNWSKEYAEAEWQWYLSGDASTDKLGELYGKVPPIWEKMSTGPNNFVNSNYGYQWERAHQLDKVVQQLLITLTRYTRTRTVLVVASSDKKHGFSSRSKKATAENN